MNLASLILQTAIAVMTFINSNPGIPQWQHDQGIAIAQQALQFANQTVGYNNNTGYNPCYPNQYPNQYPYNNTNCNNGWYNGTYNNGTYNNGCTINSYGYQSCPTVVPNGNIQILVLAPENVDSGFVQNGRNYTIVWSPFNPALGYASIQLTNSFTGNLTTIGTMNGNTLSWFPNGLAAGSYTLRILQQGSILGTRTITIQ